ncbi:4-oxalocrotonate tautomerase-like protein [Cupriavidus sp. GA3-3]|uniref:tautomerase family protein n=1 Tax=Cupriavidus sp. GA3-3 TaxID=1229514 RepID=UPI0003303D4C|nr:tautomerase family protein [Cupriavidus sp. GA3-3]EON19517.1 4-oxalocrotonate tautomerase-like protein [Cupriavidus sp. GA3-3]
MPTYVCWTKTGRLSSEQRAQIAKSVTEIHHEVGRAPRYFVQVIFNELGAQSHFIGGTEASVDQIWIRADIRSGRTQEQKDQLLMRIADEVSEIAGTSKESVWVYISDIPGPSVLEFGRILPPPGEEDTWFAALSVELQERLRSLT